MKVIVANITKINNFIIIININWIKTVFSIASF